MHPEIMSAHEILDDAGVKRARLSLPQRVKRLRDERDLALAVVQGIWAVMFTSAALSMAPEFMTELRALAAKAQQ